MARAALEHLALERILWIPTGDAALPRARRRTGARTARHAAPRDRRRAALRDRRARARARRLRLHRGHAARAAPGERRDAARTCCWAPTSTRSSSPGIAGDEVRRLARIAVFARPGVGDPRRNGRERCPWHADADLRERHPRARGARRGRLRHGAGAGARLHPRGTGSTDSGHPQEAARRGRGARGRQGARHRRLQRRAPVARSSSAW